jgi:phospholipid-binding lipoprotein MlaA
MNTVTMRTRTFIAALLTMGLITGCATSGNAKDPIEGFNRAMYAFNDGLDKAVIKPVAKGYDAVLPNPVRTGVTNFFGNIADLFIGVNNLLQGKVSDGGGDLGRVAVNTTVGVLGVFDVASRMGLEKHEEDFGQTFGRWGMGSGAYVVLPLFGPRTVRDTGGLVLDVATDPVGYIDHVPTRNTLLTLRVINDRADLLPAEKVIEEAALDKYSYIRDAYLQRRRSLIYDGNPPREAEDAP